MISDLYIQYFVYNPEAFYTASIRCGILSIKSYTNLVGILFHSSSILFLKSEIDIGFRLLIFFFKRAHTCSIGLRSGEYGGASICLTL